MPQEAPPDVPALTKMVNMQGSEETMIKTEVPDVPSLIQADANSNYQHQQATHQASPSPQSQNQGQSTQVFVFTQVIIISSSSSSLFFFDKGYVMILREWL